MPRLIRPLWRSGPATLLLMMLAMSALAAEEPQDPFDEARVRFMATEDNQELLAIVREFLAEHPEHERVADVARIGTDILLMLSDDRAGAATLVEEQLDRTTGADLQDQLRGILIGVYAHPDYREQLTELVKAHRDPQAMAFGAQLELMRSASAAEAWPLALEVASAAMANASAEAFAADYPDREYDAATLAERGENRKGLVLTQRGWARFNLGEVDAGLGDLAEAEQRLTTGFTGLPDNELHRVWGRALVAAGERGKGVKKLALVGIFGGDHEALELAREHHASLDPSQDFEAYLWQLRRESGPKLPSFEATDYDRVARDYQELKGKEATLLTFWFPT